MREGSRCFRTPALAASLRLDQSRAETGSRWRRGPDLVETGVDGRDPVERVNPLKVFVRRLGLYMEWN